MKTIQKNKRRKSKYKLNIHRGGSIYAENALSLFYKLIIKKYA
jgi:hypothetical protein